MVDFFSNPQWLVAIGTILLAVITFILAFIALFQDWLRSCTYKPGLDIENGLFYTHDWHVPVLNKQTGEFVADSCYLQLKIHNNGPASAEKAEVFIAKLERESGGVFKEVVGFYPLNLKWRHYNTIFLDRLSPKTSRDCTLGSIVEPDKRVAVGYDHPTLKLPENRSPFRLELATIPSNRCDLLAPGKYQLHLEIGSSNSRRPKKRKIILEFSGEWLPNPIDMAKVTVV